MRTAFWPAAKIKNIVGTFAVCVQFIIPVLILFYCYGRILWIITKRIDSNFNRNVTQTDMFQAARNQTIKLLVIVALFFVICWSNNQVYYLMYNLGYGIDWNGTYYQFTVLMVFLNCTINPFIYIVKYKDYQEALRNLLCCTKQQKGENELNTSLSRISSDTFA